MTKRWSKVDLYNNWVTSHQNMSLDEYRKEVREWEKDQNRIKKLIDEETKKPPNESGNDKIKRLNKRRRLNAALEDVQMHSRKKQLKKVLETMKKGKDLKNKEEQLKKLQDKRKLKKAFDTMKAKHSLFESKTMPRDLAKDTKEHGDKGKTEEFRKRKEAWMKEHRKAKEKTKDETTNETYNDKDFRYCIEQFLQSCSLNAYLLKTNPFIAIMKEQSYELFNMLYPDNAKNNQFPISKTLAWGCFKNQYQYPWDYEKAFRTIIDDYPHNFFDTDEEMKAYQDKVLKKMDKELADRTAARNMMMMRNLYKKVVLQEAKNEAYIKAHSLRYEPKAIKTHDLAKDVKAYRDKHIDELRAIQSNITFDSQTRKDGGLDENSRLVVQPLVKLILSFIRNKGYSINDTEDIIKGIGFSIDDEYIDLIKKKVQSVIDKEKSNLKQQAIQQAKQTKRQEVAAYPPRFTTSKPKPIVEIKSTHKPNLNLSHIQQVHQPDKVSPSENTRRRGQIEGLEEDNRIWNSEKDLYIKAWDKIGDDISKLPQKTGIHATNDVRAAVKGLKHGKAISNRLTSWR